MFRSPPHHMDAATAAALSRARAAIAAIGESPPAFVKGMRETLEKAEAALGEQPRGKWPGKPDKHKYLGKLRADDSLMPAREEAYAALENLQEVGFAALPNDERQRSKRQKRVDGKAADATAADALMAIAGAAGASACRPPSTAPIISRPPPRSICRACL